MGALLGVRQMTRGKAESLIGQTCNVMGRVDTVILDGNSYRIRLILPGGVIQEFDGDVFQFCELDASADTDQVKYERDFLLMLILDAEEFGPGAFDHAVEKLRAWKR